MSGRIVQDPIYGYRRLDPIPLDGEIAEFYQSQYYDLIREGGRASGLRRLMAGGEEAERERAWLSATLYSDILYVLDQHAAGKRVLDVGCGTGEFLLYLSERGFNVVGIELSSDAAAIAGSHGLTVHNSTLEKVGDIGTFDVITLLNVLEHVPDPVGLVESAKKIMEPGGILCVRVPNDFNELQLAARKQLNGESWWIAIPDHINYFDFQSLHTLLRLHGFDVVYSQADFPMELFLLMGDNYVGNPEVGNRCHQKRMRFEMAISGKLRRRLYRALAEVGEGRACLVFGEIQ